MTEGVESVTSAALALALDAASLRQQAYAANIANVGSEGYAPLRVSFESQLEEARAELAANGRLGDAAPLADVAPVLEEIPRDSTGLLPSVQLDVEVAAMSQNAVQYQTLLRAVSKHYTLLASAVSDGKK